MNKMAVLGFDGLDPFILMKHIDRLPNLRHIIEEGFFSKLQSTVPPITSSAWTSMVTGMNPGKTGILGFYQKTEDGQQFRSIATAKLRHPKMWDVVDKYKGKSVVLNVPIPGVSKINGIYTSGRFGPLNIHPQSAREILLREGYENTVVDIIHSGSSTDGLFDKVLDVEYKRLKVGMKLIDDKNPDFVFFVFNIPDAIHHIIDDEEMITRLYEKVDAVIGLFTVRFKNLFVVSDHGFSSKPFDYTFNFLGWLAENGLSKVKVDRLLQLKITAKKTLSKMRLYNKDIQSEFHMRNYRIDWKRTIVFTEPCLPAFYVNKKCESFTDMDSLFHNLKDKLEKITFDGKKYNFSLYRREDLYKGENLHLLPEFIIDAPEELVFRDTINPEGIFSSPRVWKRNHSKLMTFMGRGEMIRAGVKSDGSIYDICPTILCAMGLPMLEDKDGEILDVFTENYKKNYIEKSIKLQSTEEDNEGGSLEDEKEIEKRLKSLGYL